MTHSQILHMRISPEDRADIDLLRKEEPDLPSRSEMVRRLVQRAVTDVKSKRKGAKQP